jgi:hypothetical protein
VDFKQILVVYQHQGGQVQADYQLVVGVQTLGTVHQLVAAHQG